VKRFKGGANHFENFLKAVRSRRHTDLNADILEGHLSSALCHTGNISYRLGQKYSAEQIKERIKADKEASESFGRMTEHLERNKVDLKAANIALGPVLTMDPKTERFKDNAEANTMLTRNYRAPYVIPDQV
jgi:hypothetical protein